MQRVSILALLSTMAITPALAQTAPDGGSLGLRGSDLVGNGPSRQLPNMQPSTVSQPVSDATTSWPTAAAPYKGYEFAGGTLRLGITAGTFYDDNVFAGRTNRLSDVSFAARPEFSWINQGANEVQYVTTTQHSSQVTYARSQVRFDGTHPKVV